MTIADDKVVSLHYTLKDEKGAVIDSSSGGEPLVYLHGAGSLVPGLEEALEGKTSGAKFAVSVPPHKGYGERNESMVQTVPKDQFQDAEKIKPGMQFQLRSPNGDMILTVKEVTLDSVIVDANPPLAGQTLNFDIEVTDVRDATEEELEHGHVHGPGGHDHG